MKIKTKTLNYQTKNEYDFIDLTKQLKILLMAPVLRMD